MKKLTQSQHKFVCGILSGKTQEAAYAEAFPKSKKWSRAVRESTASRTLKLPHVHAFYQEEREKADEALREEARKKNLWNRRRSIEALVGLVKIAYEDLKTSQENQKKVKELAQRDPDSYVEIPLVVTSVCSNTITRAVSLLTELTENDSEEGEKSMARQLIDLNPDLIEEDPMDYAVSVKREGKKE